MKQFRRGDVVPGCTPKWIGADACEALQAPRPDDPEPGLDAAPSDVIDALRARIREIA